MIKIYTVSSCTSCKKAKTWLNAHQLTYKEQNLGKEGITKEELLDILTKTENGVASIVSSKNRAFLPRSVRNVENAEARMRAAL